MGFFDQPSAIFGGADTPLAQQFYVYRNGQPVPYVPPSLDEAKQAAWGMTGIPDLQQAYKAAQRGEYLPALGQGLFGALGLASMAAPAAKGAMGALKAAGPVLADTSGALNLRKLPSLADQAEALRLENTGITPNAMESGGFFQRLAQQLQPQGIRAYHGSPHDFDRFDMSKIGTGEGAQAYGHGLYFAEAEPVAWNYRYINAPVGQNTGAASFARQAASAADNAGLSGDEARKYALDLLHKKALEHDPSGRQIWFDAANNYDALIGNTQPPGRMYEVNINASPESFLNWDKPLSEQNSTVKAAFDALNVTPGPRWELLPNSNLMTGAARLSPEEASAAMRDAGIPGIRYLDQGSRGAGQGSSNYVLFDDSLIDILRKYGLAGLAAPGALSLPFTE